jgi:hypothetical protein
VVFQDHKYLDGKCQKTKLRLTLFIFKVLNDLGFKILDPPDGFDVLLSYYINKNIYEVNILYPPAIFKKARKNKGNQKIWVIAFYFLKSKTLIFYVFG